MNRFIVSTVSLLPVAFLFFSQAVPSAEASSSAFSELKNSAGPAAPGMVAPVPIPAGLKGEALFQELHTAVLPPRGAQHTYKEAKVFMFLTSDRTDCGGAPGVMTLYSQVCVRGTSSSGNGYPEDGDQNGDGVIDTIVNTEHVWPQSFFGKSLPMVADLHQLAPTLATPNNRRGNLPFAVVSKYFYFTLSGSRLGPEGFEPADAVKGNVARAMLYFIVRYYDMGIRNGMDYADFWTRRVPMFMEWNRQDPPDAAERRRNDLIEEFQGNRNPFVDDPSFADRIGEQVFMSH